MRSFLNVHPLFVLALLLCVSSSTLAHNREGEIIVVHTIQQLQDTLATLQEGAVIFIDVDDTLITPKSKVFHWASPYRFLIDDLKKNRDKIPNFEEILSHWRLQRETMLVSEEWPKLMNTLKEKYPVYALTKMETGSIGAIPSMEQWRYDELTHKGISFTPFFKEAFKSILRNDLFNPYPITFFHGIFITGSYTKGDVLDIFLETQTPTQVVLIDDREEHLRDVKEACARHGIPFLGIFFKGMDLIPGLPDPKVAAFQKEHLLTHAEWWEDEKAESMIREKQ